MEEQSGHLFVRKCYCIRFDNIDLLSAIIIWVNPYPFFIFLQLNILRVGSGMEKEIEDLRRRYNAKRQPILDAMDQKRKRQQNF